MPDQFDRLKTAVADRYQLERHLGEGGMATVYLARDLKHDRKVAIKVLRPELAAVLGAERFIQEIKTTANLHHPHILPLFDSGEADGLLYYVMPYVDGETLREKLNREKQLGIEEAVRITCDVADALDYAHRHNVIHRDIKPENILLHDGRPTVADFGIALAVADAGSDRLTQTGISVGTPSYMSPEQAAGDSNIDHRTDIYALGSLVHEMVTGEPPFTGNTVQAVLARVMTEVPRSLRAANPSVPKALDVAVQKALAKDPDERFQSSGELASALAIGTGAVPSATRLSPRGRRLLVGVTVTAVVILAAVGYTLYRGFAGRQWVRDVAIPDLERLTGEGRFSEAYQLVTAAQARAPNDSIVRSYLERSTGLVDITTEPPGARVTFSGYSLTDTTWHEVGVTPVEQVRLPWDLVRLRLELDDHEPLEVAFFPHFGNLAARLSSLDDAPNMVWVPAGTYAYTGDPVSVDAFRIDRHEVTNAEYQTFVDADGYEEREFWTERFVRDGRTMSRAEAMRAFVDATGRPGPAGWELSRYPGERANLPVGGVSWFEAAAYCTFVGKSLPTYYHWGLAAGLGVAPWDDILRLSNFGGPASVPVESLRGTGPYGTYDMAGNVREWVWNANRDFRQILGGAWTDPEYIAADGDATDPWSRDPGNGFRCAKYETPPTRDQLAPIEQPFFDFNTVEPVDDATFEIYRKFYEYEPTALDARVESVDSMAQWVKEKVSFTAAYGDERVSAYVFLPRSVSPPYQTVVYFPGVSAFFLRSSDNLAEMATVSFVPLSGRALVYPIYKGSYERYMETRRPGLPGARERMIWRTQDLMRTVDYVMEREDLDNDAVGYLGLSLGAEIAVPFALEKRFKALVLVGGAFDAAWLPAVPAEAAPWNFASRITTPAMLINGRRDFMHHYETGQIPYFNAFDVPDSLKQFVELEAGHIPPWNDVIRHALEWYDRFLGRVR